MDKIKPTILYVDDEEINLRTFRNTFRRKYKVVTQNSGKLAIEYLKENEVDLVITDQRMPNMSGVELLSKIHQMLPQVPPGRLMVSGYSEPEEIEKAFKDYGLFKFISKPWDANELDKVFKEVLNI